MTRHRHRLRVAVALFGQWSTELWIGCRSSWYEPEQPVYGRTGIVGYTPRRYWPAYECQLSEHHDLTFGPPVGFPLREPAGERRAHPDHEGYASQRDMSQRAGPNNS